MKTFEEELKNLITLAHDAGYLEACWQDGGDVSNEAYEKSQKDLAISIEEFLKKFGLLAQR